MEQHINNLINYLTNNYANYIDSIHAFVPAQFKYSMEGEFGGTSKKYARVLISVNKRNCIDSYYRSVREKIDLDMIKKQISYGFVLFKNSNLFNAEQFNIFIDNIVGVYTNPMHRVENVFRKCKFSSHKNSRIEDEYKPISYSDYCLKFNVDGMNQDVIDASYFKYIRNWVDGDIEYIHSFIALENFDGLLAGDILGVKDFDKANKDKIVGNVMQPANYFDVDWRTI